MPRQLPIKPRHFSGLFEEYGQGSIARLPAHQNGGLELHYIASGHLHWKIENKVHLIPPRSIFFTFPWERHGGTSDFEPGHYFHFAVFRLQNQKRLNPQKLRLVRGFSLAEEEQAQIFEKLLHAKNRCCPAGPMLATMMINLVAELTHPGPLAKTRVVALSQAILCELVKRINDSSSPSPAASSGREQVLRFVDDLRNRCHESWSLSSMAAACHLGRTRFESLTREITGDNPSMLLNRFRVRRAQQLLREGLASVTDIAFLVGFNSSQYFSRIFRSFTGTTPSRYREAHGNTAVYDQRFQKALGKLRPARSRLTPTKL